MNRRRSGITLALAVLALAALGLASNSQAQGGQPNSTGGTRAIQAPVLTPAPISTGWSLPSWASVQNFRVWNGATLAKSPAFAAKSRSQDRRFTR